jgi:hypothetical protein
MQRLKGLFARVLQPRSNAARRARPAPRARLRVEGLEERLALSTYQVNSLQDSGAGSGLVGDLRYCITQSNATPGGNTIVFDVRGTITLTGALPALSHDVAINGPADASLTISGNHANRVLAVNAGVTASITNVTISAGRVGHYDPEVEVPPENGGGVSNLGQLTVSDCTLSDNLAVGFGGGIYNAGTLTVRDSNLSTNAAVYGGGIANAPSATLAMAGCTISHNAGFVDTSLGFDYGYGGGGVEDDDGVLTMTNCIVSRNVSNGGGRHRDLQRGGLATPPCHADQCHDNGQLDFQLGRRRVEHRGGAPDAERLRPVRQLCRLRRRGPRQLVCRVVHAQRGGPDDPLRLHRVVEHRFVRPPLLDRGGRRRPLQLRLARRDRQYGVEQHRPRQRRRQGRRHRELRRAGDEQQHRVGQLGPRQRGGILASAVPYDPTSSLPLPPVWMVLTNVTITANRADTGGAGGAGGGLAVTDGEPLLRNTLIAGNFNGASGGVRDDVSGVLCSTSDHNLIGDGTGITGISNGTNGNLVGSAASPIDPLLGPLADNGGPTQTHALLPGSPARRAGNPAYATDTDTDQRGQPRLVGGMIDIGAYQSQS